MKLYLDDIRIQKNFKFNVHSSNPISKANIEEKLNNYFSKFLNLLLKTKKESFMSHLVGIINK